MEALAHLEVFTRLEKVATLCRSFEVEGLTNIEVLEDVPHDCEVDCAPLTSLVSILNLVKAEEATDETFRIISHVKKIVLEGGAELLKLAPRDRLQHKFFILSVVEEGTALTRRAQLK